jgi:hypothetical protein
MMTKTALIVTIALVLGASGAFAQTAGVPDRPSVFNDYLNPQSGASFLRVPGLSFSSSMGFSYFSGGGLESFGMGYYMGHFGLKLSSSLSLNWDVGVGSMMRSTTQYDQPAFFLPNVDLTYRPSDSFMMRFEFHQYRYPGYYMLGR